MNKKLTTLVVTLAAAGSIFAVMAYNGSQMQSQMKQRPPQAQATYPNVGVIQVNKDAYQAQITGYGEVSAKYTLDLASEVAGRVEQLADAFATGREVKKGDVLLTLNTLEYQQAVASAKATLAQAKMDLLEEQREGEQARDEWQASGMQGEPDSPLVLRQPQLEVAEAAVEEAKASLALAQWNLAQTQLRAPFDGVITARDVTPGSYLQSGTVVATLVSTQQAEIRVPLSDYQWQNLPDNQGGFGWTAQIESMDGSVSWQGYIDRVEQHLDSTNRQRSLVAVVDKPLAFNHPLLSGSFVKVTVTGRELPQLWQIPASAITQDGVIWYVDAQGQLAKFNANKRYESGDFAYVSPPAALENASIVVRPLNTYTVGMRVHAVEDKV